MRAARIAAAANPYAALIGTVFVVAMLLATISLTTFDRQWVVFLGGVLAAAILAFVSHTTNARWIIARRTAQLNVTRAKLATELRLRAHAEESLARVRNNVELVNEALPAMLAYVDGERRVRYHNHAFARWVGLEDKSIDGQRVEDIVGRTAYREIEQYLGDALQGRDVRYEHIQKMRNGESCRLNAQYLPHHAADGNVAGVFAILTDITRAADLGSANAHDLAATQAPDLGGARAPDVDGAAKESPAKAADDSGARLISALERNEFSLYSQAIASLGDGAPEACCEVLLRMKEEEEKQLPPGSFLPLAEELGLLHEIDRWVVRHVVDFAADARPQTNATYFVNLSAPTILDPGFPQFVRERLQARRVPDHTLCFELPEADVLANPAAYREFIGALDGTGCRFAVSGFGCNPLSMRFLKNMRVDFVKIDGGIVLNMLRSPGGLSKVKAINLAVHAAGMRSIAQCVESDSTRAALAAIETDFAQGFGIARPRPIGALDDRVPARASSRALEQAAA
jgi:PAS domain S-box-containing protein